MGDAVEPLAGLHQLLPTRDHDMNHQLAAGGFQGVCDAVLHEVAGQGHERGGPVVHDEVGVLGHEALDHAVHGMHVDLVAVRLEQVHGLDLERLQVAEGGVDRIRVEADDGLALLNEVLGDQAGDVGFADAAFALHDGVDAARGATCGCRGGSRGRRAFLLLLPWCVHRGRKWVWCQVRVGHGTGSVLRERGKQA
jgi:hypothetical protein